MKEHIGVLWVVGFCGSLAIANAQTPSPPTTITQFDGTYAFVSSAKVNEIYYAWGSNRIGQCGDLSPPGPLAIVNGHVRYNAQEGIVGPQGELTIRLEPTPFGRGGGNEGIEITSRGRIDANGTVRARRTGYNCRYDLIWQKVQSLSFPIPSTQFDGTYAVVSSTKVNETHVNRATGQIDQCPERRGGTLTVINGQAHLPNFEGTVGSHGELAMIRVFRVEGTVSGAIYRDGTVKARRTVGDCSYDTIWQKGSK